MKNLIILIVLLIFSSYVNARVPLREQWEIVTKMAKEQRRELWQKGHDSVRSKETKITKKELHSLTKNSLNSFKPLSDSEMSELFLCVEEKECTVFIIDLYSNYMSGYGHDRLWVMMNNETGQSKILKEAVYSE